MRAYSVSFAQAVMPGMLSLSARQRNRFVAGPGFKDGRVLFAMSITKWEAVEALPPFPRKKIVRSSSRAFRKTGTIFRIASSR